MPFPAHPPSMSTYGPSAHLSRRTFLRTSAVASALTGLNRLTPGYAQSTHGGLAAMPGMEMPAPAAAAPMADMPGMAMPAKNPPTPTAPVAHGPDTHGAGNSTVAMSPRSRLHEPGSGLEDAGHRVLVYTDLRSLRPRAEVRPPACAKPRQVSPSNRPHPAIPHESPQSAVRVMPHSSGAPIGAG